MPGSRLEGRSAAQCGSGAGGTLRPIVEPQLSAAFGRCAYGCPVTPANPGRHAWVDATAGIAGDMLLAALLDAGAPLDRVITAVNAVIPGSVLLTSSQVSRAGMRSTKVDVKRVIADQTHRSWREIQTLLGQADLAPNVRERAQRVFHRLAEAEARVHGITTDDVRFHEVGAWDSIADVVGVCAALDWLGVTSLSGSAVALGSGWATSGHGELPVPVPAALELSSGWQVMSGGEGELATPTGMALITTLADECGALPAMTVRAIGVGAGTRDTAGHPNVVRVVIGDRHGYAAESSDTSVLSVLETNIDDMDPRVWPTVLASLFAAGAADAWLVPIIMKKGRPAQTLTVLTSVAKRDELRRLIFELTTTSGVRETTVSRLALDRFWVPLSVAGGQVRVKVAYQGGEIVQATPEFDEAAAVAMIHDVPVRRVLQEAIAAAERAGLVAGRPVPESLPCGTS
jgi:pyridinium-3,5-bisthiocarboxylic acid mononucleotide nickel chelatase